MQVENNLFENIKQCEVCRRPLPAGYEPSVCPACQEAELFSKVRDYIRENDVNEFEVAEHFNLPVFQVRHWIREGRIEYKSNQPQKMTQLFCVACGAKINFGAYCQSCYKLKHMPKATYVGGKEESKMRFLDNE